MGKPKFYNNACQQNNVHLKASHIKNKLQILQGYILSQKEYESNYVWVHNLKIVLI